MIACEWSAQEKQLWMIDLFFSENKLVCRHLIAKDYPQLLDRSLKEFYPLPETLFDSDCEYFKDIFRLQTTNPIRTLEIIEEESPILLHRDLSSLSLLRQGCYTKKRADKVAGIMEYSSERSGYLALESALSLSHPLNWGRPLSRWWNWKRFIDLIEEGLRYPQFSSWAAYGFLWSFWHQTNDPHQVDPTDPSFRSLVDALEPFLAIDQVHDRELKMRLDILLHKKM